MAVQYRCKHRGHPFASKQEKLAARRERFDVPADAEWKPVQDARMGKHAIVELYDVPSGSKYTVVVCQLCGNEIKVVTDQDVTS